MKQIYTIPNQTRPITRLEPSFSLASKHLRSRNRIRLRLVRVIRNPRVAPLVRSRKRNQPTRWHCRPRARDLQLVAPRVELRTRIRIRSVQRNDLMAHEIVSRLQARRHRVRSHAASFHELRSAPYIGRSGAAFFLDLEPHGTKSYL